MNPESHPLHRWRVFKRDGSWRIRILVEGSSWGAIPRRFASAQEAWKYLEGAA